MLGPTSPGNSSSPQATTPNGSRAQQRSPTSAVSPPSRHPQDGPHAIASTGEATATPTQRSTESPSAGYDTTTPPAPTEPDAQPNRNPPKTSSAPSSATSLARSTKPSEPTSKSALDIHRSIRWNSPSPTDGYAISRAHPDVGRAVQTSRPPNVPRTAKL